MVGSATFHSSIGLRSYQEGRSVYIISPFGYLLAIFDGHGGKEVAEIAAKNLLIIFNQESAPLREKGQVDYDTLLQNVTAKLNLLTKDEYSGSTMSLVFIPTDSEDHTAYIAVLGDSPVVISDYDGKTFLGPDHNVRSNLTERTAATKRGGVFSGGYICDPRTGEGLQMSRALGDSSLGEMIDHKPELKKVRLGRESIVLVASDGLFDPNHTSDPMTEATRFIEMIRNGSEAKDLVDDALSRKTGDNVTAIVFRFNPRSDIASC